MYSTRNIIENFLITNSYFVAKSDYWRKSNMPDKEILIDNQPYFLHTHLEDDTYFNSIASSNIEPSFNEIINSLLEENSVALDIGANIGITSLLLAHKLKKGQVIGFEPGTNLYNTYKLNMEKNNLQNVHPINAAVSSETRTVSFHENSAYGHIDMSNKERQITSVRLDDFMMFKGLKNVDFIKIDVEGREWDVLNGAGSLVTSENGPLIYLEFNIWTMVAYSPHNPYKFLDYLFDTFKYVAVIPAGVDIYQGYREVHKEELINILIEHFFPQLSISDILVTNNLAYIEKIKKLPFSKTS